MTAENKATEVEVKNPRIKVSSSLKAGGCEKLDVWSIFSPSQMPKDTINLGQGFMSWAPPDFLKKAAEDIVENDVMAHHYSPARGRPSLRQAISDHYSSDFQRQLNPETEILVTAGANEGMYATLLAFLNQGDEVICIEPFFDQYTASIIFNGGKPVYVPLHPPKEQANAESGPGKVSQGSDWTVDFDELRAAITPKTKVLIINTPHNPVGKVFTRQELEQFGALAKEFNFLILSDEVYDCLTFDENEHVRIANLPGMWERTITVGSAGKSFAATGWRIGWLIGPEHLITPALAASTRIIFCVNGPLQEATAKGLALAKTHRFFETQRAEYAARRKVLTDIFDQLGLPYTMPQGAYFILVDLGRFKWPENYVFPDYLEERGRDFKVCWFLGQELGVVAIPPSEFYTPDHVHIGERFARFAFCKDIDTLKAAGVRLQKITQYLHD
ncbi:1-aminocyclopropane-1-carboxylate synthase, and related proteins [Phaffia rhodozyma]|uniref:1-aminocyclopropane-1-carboxylate synthase, and related proteins n=1 Tax=Phaffia rhodozyma TaxID=264483 RepID=A0A0F7SGE6_PHARH|nr:1-aminocyclopropane-1-carboxylate synthase, and related proteins [Phaffia rhodozyma]